MALNEAIQILAAFAAEKVVDCPPEQQIKVYQALAEALPDSAARAHARELAMAQSRVAALQMDFQQLLKP